MNYRVTHTTRYRYSEPVNLCHNEVRLSPRDLPSQVCIRSHLTVMPRPASLRERTDFFGNRVHYFSIQVPHKELTVTAASHIRLSPRNVPTDFDQSMPWEKARSHLRTGITREAVMAQSFSLNSPLIAATETLRAYALPSFPPNRPLLACAGDLMSRIHAEFEFKPGFTTVSTPLSDVLTHRRGVCQDFAQLAIGCLRAMGLAARYVSGYLETIPPPGKERLKGADVSHAWFATYVPNTGWIDFDPTNNVLPDQRHITTAWGRDFSDVTPLKGVIFGGGRHTLQVSVDVEPDPAPAQQES